LPRQRAAICHFKPLSMTYSRTAWSAIALIALACLFMQCSKTEPEFPIQNTLQNKSGQLVTDWTQLNLEVSQHCNGYQDPITSRAMYYTALTLYETVRFGLNDCKSLQTKLAGFQTTLSQPDYSQRYNFLIVANQALYRVSTEMFKPAGVEQLAKIEALKNLYLQQESSELDENTIFRSVSLGNEIGWKMIEFSQQDGNSSAYLHLYPAMGASTDPGCWRPTPPDYSSKALLPEWGNAQLCLANQFDIIKSIAPKVLQYSDKPSSIIYAEANEVYSLSKNLDTQQRDLLEYWNSSDDFHASPLLHNYLLMVQLIQEHKLNLEQSAKLFVKLSISLYDGYIVAWNLKYKTNLMRPATYIRQHIERYYVPEYISPTSPEFVSDKAVVYAASSVIFSETFGYRFAFMDYTQSSRQDLRENRKFFESFESMAKEAAYSDMLSATQYRTSIHYGLEAGTAVGLNVAKLKF